MVATDVCVPVWEQRDTERNHGRHRVWTVVTKQPLIRNTTTATTETSGRSHGYWRQTLATWAPFPPATNRKLEMGEWEGLQWNVVAAGWWKCLGEGQGGQRRMLLVLFLWFWWFLFSGLILRRRLLVPAEEERQKRETNVFMFCRTFITNKQLFLWLTEYLCRCRLATETSCLSVNNTAE